MIRRFGTPPRRERRYRSRPGVYAVLRQGSEVLLTAQTRPHFEFQLPGGGIDPGESAQRALYREVFEETGWTIAAPRRLGVFRRFTFMPEYEIWAEKLCTVYQARPVRRIGPPSEAGHHAVWLPVAVAGEVLGNDGDRHFLRRFIR